MANAVLSDSLPFVHALTMQQQVFNVLMGIVKDFPEVIWIFPGNAGNAFLSLWPEFPGCPGSHHVPFGFF